MTLNPQVAALLDVIRQNPLPDFGAATPQTLRAAFDNPMRVGPPPEVARVEDVEIALDDGVTLPARLYTPHAEATKSALTLYYHGGGWVVGTLETHDATCRALARESGAAVLSVGYRLAPEFAYPTPLEDCYAALVWAAAHAEQLGCDDARLAVAGDSAGGNLAAAVALLARDRTGPNLAHQLLIYPVTDADFTRPSYIANGAGDYFLSTAGMQWFWDQYLGGRSAAETPLAAVLHADLSGLPSATVLTAEYDPLRDEGQAFAARLAQAGVVVEAKDAPGMIHGFFSMFEAIPDAYPWVAYAGAQLKQAFAR
jgi:acetyl esterase